MKRILSIVLVLSLTVALFAGCGSKGTESDEWEYYSEIVTGGNKADGDTTGSESTTESGKTNGKSDSKSDGKSDSKNNSSVSTPSTTHKGGDLTVEGAGTDKNADYTVSGTITVSIDTSRNNDYEALFDSFKKVYKNVKLKFDYFSNGTDATEYLSTRAAAGNMPDIVYDDAGSLPTKILQGWVHPLDEFVKNDPDYKNYVPANLKSDYTFGGKLYALPHQAHFETFLLNTDVLNKLNLSKPSLDWTFEDFADYCKKATTDTYSAQEDFGALYSTFVNCFDSSATLYGYNPSTKKINASGLITSIKKIKELRTIPGLEANSLKSNMSDYTKKFGTGGWSDGWVAFHKGLTLFHGLGTWEYKNKRETVTNFNWIMWTFPQSSSGVMPYHVDHCFMTSSCKNTAAAWQLLRYCTYSYEGNIARLSMYDDTNKGKYALQNSFYYPTCTHPKVVEKFNSLPGVKSEPVAEYLQANIGKCFRYDMVKIVPDWNNIVGDVYSGAIMTAVNGADSLVEQTINQYATAATKRSENAWSEFNTKLKKVQAQFK